MSRASTRLRFIEPQLPTLVDQPPEGADGIHEIKHARLSNRDDSGHLSMEDSRFEVDL